MIVRNTEQQRELKNHVKCSNPNKLLHIFISITYSAVNKNFNNIMPLLPYCALSFKYLTNELAYITRPRSHNLQYLCNDKKCNSRHQTISPFLRPLLKVQQIFNLSSQCIFRSCMIRFDIINKKCFYINPYYFCSFNEIA